MAGSQNVIRVLHVDDEPDFGELVAAFLEREDERINVETAENARDGMSRLEENGFDCVISDYDMPGQDGIDFLDEVRQEYSQLPFILYTGKGSEEVASEAISTGVTDYLQKNGGTDQYAILANRVSNAVERYQAERRAEETRAQLTAIAENSTDAIISIDSNSRIKFANPAVEALFGYSPDELEGGSLTTLMPERYQDAHHEAIDRYLETRTPSIDWSAVEFPAKHEDGHEFSVSISFGEYERNGQQHFIGIIRNVN